MLRLNLGVSQDKGGVAEVVCYEIENELVPEQHPLIGQIASDCAR